LDAEFLPAGFIFDQCGEGANRDSAKKGLIAPNLRHQLLGKSLQKDILECFNLNSTQIVV